MLLYALSFWAGCFLLVGDDYAVLPYDYYTETGWMTKNQQPITNWKSTLLYWNQSEGTPHKKTKQEEPRSENADIYESLIGRVLL